jgi:hypothetical protein
MYSIRMFGNKQKPKITSNKNITTIETGTGTYTILYGLHVVAQNPDEVPDRINGIILETGIQQWLEDPVKTPQRLKKHLQYKLLFDRLEKEKISVLFADVKYKYNNFALIIADNVFTAVGWIGGMRLINQMIRNDNKPKKGFATKLTYGLAGAWLLLPVVSNMTRLVSSVTGEGMEQSARLKKLLINSIWKLNFSIYPCVTPLSQKKHIILRKRMARKRILPLWWAPGM